MTRSLVVGFGLTGQDLAGVLSAREEPPIVIEDHPGPDSAQAAAAAGVDMVVAPDAGLLAALVQQVDQVVPSPGVAPTHPVYALAEEAGTPVVSEIEVAWRLLAERGQRGTAPALVAVTGTNGKTTVATWVAGILREAGRRVVLAGNVGRPLVGAVSEDADVIVAEVSSFQLHFSQEFHPWISCWLNISDDHLDWHPIPAHYATAKARVWANQAPGDSAVVNAEDPTVMSAAASLPQGVREVCFSTRRSDCDFSEQGPSLLGPGGQLLMGVEALPRSLPHDRANALAAAAVAWAAGADLPSCARGLRHAPALPHRVTLVAEAGGVGWYDDSKATTPASVRAAVEGFDSVVLIAGGRNKGLDLSVLSSLAPPVKAVVGIGEAAPEVSGAFRGKAATWEAKSMEAAVELAAAAAVPGDTVLLSPGCASFDWYASYSERGDHFAALVRKIVSGRQDDDRDN
ncbi:MAG: UDP-N-acetylmuramoyl-L-alanine--D-glutamate ligase [Acidimicrobiales bacterium]